MESCPSGKRLYADKQLAEEALIQHHIRNNYRAGEGPVNVYQCPMCGNWHFTSKGEMSELFEDEETRRFIERERRSFEWEQKLR